MSDPAELDLVRRAICEARTTTGCCEWDGRAAERLRRDRAALRGLTLQAVKKAPIDFVVAGGEIRQLAETRPEYNDRGYYYKAVVPVFEFAHGLFVEIILSEPDPELPGVLMVNAHEQQP
jgi:hypothetical protein